MIAFITQPINAALKRTVNSILSWIESSTKKQRIIVNEPADLGGSIDSTKEYYIDGVIDMTGSGVSAFIPAEGMTISGAGYKVSKIKCTDANYHLFKSPLGGCGGFIFKNVAFEITGENSKVYGDLTPSSNFEAIELYNVNYENCVSLGKITGFRQVFASGIGFTGGTPELELDGTMNGYKIVQSNALQLSNLTALFKAGPSLIFTGRFSTNIKCNLPAVGAFADFTEANFADDELFEINDASFTRSNAVDYESTTIIPNITQKSLKSKWSNVTGLPSTQKYLLADILAPADEVVTSLPNADEYTFLNGSFTVIDSSHFEMSSNGIFKKLTGYDWVKISGDIIVEGTANDLLDLRIIRSSDGFSTFDVVRHIPRRVNNDVGPSDSAVFPFKFGAKGAKGDEFGIQIERKAGSSGTSVTMKAGSFIDFDV